MPRAPTTVCDRKMIPIATSMAASFLLSQLECPAREEESWASYVLSTKNQHFPLYGVSTVNENAFLLLAGFDEVCANLQMRELHITSSYEVSTS